MGSQTRYSINLEARFSPLELIDVQTLVDACKDAWYNQTLCRIAGLRPHKKSPS